MLTPKMFEPLTQRRYLLPFKAARLPQQFTDVLIIGGGVAGLRAAIAAEAEGADVLILTKDTIDESNTWYAQGGIAAVLQPTDTTESHIHDTEVGGAGLCDNEAVKIVVEEGPERVLELLEWGAHFDKKEGNPHGLAFTREGGHSSPRILHAFGDATGKELAQTLIRTVRSKDAIRISQNSFVIDLLTDDADSGRGTSVPLSVWTSAYCNDMYGYVPTSRVQQEGGYEGGRANLWSWLPSPWTSTVENRITTTVHQLVQQVTRSTGVPPVTNPTLSEHP